MSIFTLFTDLDELDGQHDGFVDTQQFIDLIQNLIGPSQVKDVDLEFLSLKYRKNESYLSLEERNRVYYKAFYNDYEYLEINGLSKKIFGVQRDMSEATGTGENPFSI